MTKTTAKNKTIEITPRGIVLDAERSGGVPFVSAMSNTKCKSATRGFESFLCVGISGTGRKLLRLPIFEVWSVSDERMQSMAEIQEMVQILKTEDELWQ